MSLNLKYINQECIHLTCNVTQNEIELVDPLIEFLSENKISNFEKMSTFT